MNYYLIKLSFDTAVHFGTPDSALSLYTSEDHFCADTLFSALCHTAYALNGDAGVKELISQAEKGELLLSDGMPWREDTLYLPKPCVSGESSEDVPPELRKAMKKLAWIPLSAFSDFVDSVHGNAAFNAADRQESFGVADESTKVSVAQGREAIPYQVGLYRFFDNCGLWFIAGCATEEQGDSLEHLVKALGISGIGGKTSAGYGRFHLDDVMWYLNEPFDDDTQWLYDALVADKANRQLLLTTSLPAETELEALLPGAEYRLTRRGGFARPSGITAENRKKRVQFFLSAGSVLSSGFAPTLYPVGETANHQVYRFSGPIFLGVDL